MKKKVGIFYVNAGGGHSSAAKALAQEIVEKHSNEAEPFLIDAMHGDLSLARWFLERGYLIAINSLPHNWKIIYWFSKMKAVMLGEDKFFTRTIKKNVAEIIEKEKFDVIITVHFFLTSPVLAVLKEKKINAPVYSIVTDPFSAPPAWFINKDVNYFVFSEIIKKLAIDNDIKNEQIFVVPPLINTKFLRARGLSKNDIRGKLNFPIDKKIILVAAGGDGLYNGGKVVKNLINLPDDFRLIIVCGREKKFFAEAVGLQKNHPNKILSVYGFAENMEELMVAADLVVGKAGPAVIFESLAVGRPLVLTHYLEQEKGNIDFVVDKKFGTYEPQPQRLSQAVVNFFSNVSEHQAVLKRINSLSFKTGVGDIANKILETKNLE